MIYLTGRSKDVFVVTMVMLVFSLVSVGLRCFVRLRLIKAFAWDDHLMVFAMVLNIALCICAMIGATYGIGKKNDEISTLDISKALLCIWLSEVIYILTCIAGKISIALTMLRVTVERSHRIILFLAIILTLIVGLMTWFILFLQCHPVSHFWNKGGHGSCLDPNVITSTAYVYSVITAVCDFTIGILPVAIVWNLQKSLQTKIAVSALLGLGCLASTAVLIRIPFVPGFKSADLLYGATQILLLSVMETGIGITAGSLTTLRPLFRPFRDGTSNHSESNTNRTVHGILQNVNVRRKVRPGLLLGPDINANTPDTTAMTTELQENNFISEARCTGPQDWTFANEDVDIGRLFETCWTVSSKSV